MRVGLVYGAWAQNIGNAFFNLGGQWLLGKTFGPENIKLVQDQPAYATFRNESKGNWPNAFDLIGNLDVDLLVLQGPLFTRTFGSIWIPSLERLSARGVQWAAVGAGFRKYDDGEFSAVSEVLRMYPPAFVSTRDQPTYKRLSTLDRLSFPIHDGIDSAFYTPEAYSPADIDISSPLMALAFDHFPEPRLVRDTDGVIEVGRVRYTAASSPGRTWMASKGKAGGIISHATHPIGPDSLGDYKIVRPNHRTNPHIPRVIYRQPNGVAWDEPYTYLTVYKASELTLSDRVHACVATLAYGGKAMLFNPVTKRSSLFERVACGPIVDRPVSLDLSMVEAEATATQRFISNEMV